MANEISRMESIVQDIEKLRFNYAECVRENKVANKMIPKADSDNTLKIELEKTVKLLEKYKTLLEKEKLKNTLLLSQKTNDEKPKKVDANISKDKVKNEKTKNISLVNDLKIKYENIIKNKDNMILSLKNKIKNSEKPIALRKEICEDDNPFPDLMMKESEKKQVLEEKPLPDSLETADLKARTYRLHKESEIYDGADGEIVFIWEDKSSLTAINMTQDWLKITGYFVDKKWTKAQKNLWVKKVNATLR